VKRSIFHIVLLCGVLIASLTVYWTVYFLQPEIHRNYFQGEDRIIEWLTFSFFCAASILSFLILVYRNTMAKLAIWYFIFMGIFLLVCAGEEISWGQRILGFETPQNIEVINEQKEFNLHNLEMKYIHPHGIFSFIMSLYGIVFPIIFSRKIRDRTSSIRRYISPLVFIPCYLFPVILGSTSGYVEAQIDQYSTHSTANQYGDLTGELREMYWGLSVFLSTLTLFILNRRTKNYLPYSSRY
jgi:hypothetical protein